MSGLNNIDLALEDKFRGDDNNATGFNHFDDDEWAEWECLYGYIVNR